MRSIILLGTMLLAAAPVVAMPFGSDSFRDAKTGYRVDVVHDGVNVLLNGYNPQTHAKFHLTVTPQGRVTGIYAGEKVNYVLPAAVQHSELVAVNTTP